MNVLIVSHLLGRTAGGGIAARSAAVAGALAREGAAVQIVGTGAGLTGPADLIHDGPVTVLRSLGGRFAIPVAAGARLDALVRWADVILLFNHWSVLNARAARAAARHGVPYVVCPSGALPSGSRSRLLKRAYNRLAGHRLIQTADAWVATTEEERRDFAPYGVAPDRVTVIPNAVDSADAGVETREDRARLLRSRFGLGDAPLLLFVGRLNPIKGPDLLVEAFAHVASEFGRYTLVLAGHDEGLRDDLARAAASHGLADRVCLTGVLDAADRAAMYATASLLIVPSRREAMSLVALEAASHGTPVLMTSVCGFDAITAVDGGAVVPPSVDGLADGLRRLLRAPLELPAMGARLRAHVRANYAWDTVAPRWERLLADAARRRRPPSRSSSARTPS